MNKYGDLIEELIALKDNHRGVLSFSEVETINRACNLFEKIGVQANPKI